MMSFFFFFTIAKVVFSREESWMSKQRMNSLILCSKEAVAQAWGIKSVLLIEMEALHWYSPTKEKWKRNKGHSSISPLASFEVDFSPAPCPVPNFPLQVKDCDEQSWGSFSEKTSVIVTVQVMVHRLLQLLGYFKHFFLYRKKIILVFGKSLLS